MLDVFKNDAFGVVALTDAINALKFVPGRIAEMGIFSATGISTLSAAIEQKDNVLELIAPTPRGGPGHALGVERRVIRAVAVPHFEINDSVMADQVQGVRAWGSETDVETVQGKIAERMAVHTQSFAATEEYSMIGAVKGVITYADSSTFDIFDFFGVSQISEVDFDLDNGSPASGALRKKCASVVRAVAAELGGTPFSGKLRAFCGDAFFDDLLAHTEVRATYTGWTDAQILREGYIEPNGKSYGAFEFGDIIFENYRGAVGSTTFVHTDKCHIFPEGVPNLFRTYWAPADYVETVNTIGKRTYAKQYDMPNGKGVHFDTQMNALNLCTRPRVLIKGKRT